MPIGLVTDDDFLQELSRVNRAVEKPPVVAEIVPETPRGRSSGDNNVPDSLRKIIGEEAVINGRQSALHLAAQFGISPSSVSAYAKGATSTTTYDQPKQGIIDHINKSRRRVVRRGAKTMEAALGAISQEKLDYADPKDLAGIAKDMSVIIKNMEPPQQSPDSPDSKQPQFVIFAPTFRDERSFETIEVKE